MIFGVVIFCCVGGLLRFFWLLVASAYLVAKRNRASIADECTVGKVSFVRNSMGRRQLAEVKRGCLILLWKMAKALVFELVNPAINCS